MDAPDFFDRGGASRVYLSDEVALDDLEEGHYQVLHADCPWRWNSWSAKGEARSPSAKYPTMPTAELCDMNVGRIGAKNSALFLWVLGEKLEDGHRVMRAWDYNCVSIAFVWVKTCKHGPVRPRIGQGYTTRKSSEVCLLGFKGRGPKRLDKGVPDTIFEPRREHSRKPDETFRRIERLYDGPYIDLFGRQPRENWSVWGREATLFAG